MLVVENNSVFVNWTKGSPVSPLLYGGDLVITFDPSKTNMAMVVGTPEGTILNHLEFSGNNRRKGPTMDTTIFCEEVRSFLRGYLSNAHLYMVATEQTIMKKGMEHYRSNKVLNEIRSNLLNMFLEDFDLKVIEINNWSWKHAVLPEGFRGQFQKGSKLFFERRYPNSAYNNYFEADMTDCVCIYWYVVAEHCKQYSMFCTRVESPLVPYSWAIYPARMVSKDIREVKYNERFTIEENLNFYVNRLTKTFAMDVSPSVLDLDILYSKANMFGDKDMHDKMVKVVGARKCG